MDYTSPPTQPELQTPLPAKRFRADFVDVGRAMAAIAVFFQHSVEGYNAWFKMFTTSYFSLGIYGVTLFFLISGYIIPPSIARIGLGRFWMGRFFRLYPLYWVSIGLVLSFIAFSPKHAHDSVGAKQVLINLTMLQEYLKVPHLMGLYWTLSLEMLFYVLCSVAFYAISPHLNFRFTLGLACMAIAIPIANAAFLDRSLPYGRLFILFSAFFGKHLRETGALGSRRNGLMMLLAAGAIFSCCIVRFGILPAPVTEDEPPFTPLCVISSYAFAYLTFITLMAARDASFPSWAISVGTWCYSIYLLHPFVIEAIPRFGPLSVWMLICLAVTLLLSRLSWHFIEKPTIAFGRRFSARVFEGAEKAPRTLASQS